MGQSELQTGLSPWGTVTSHLIGRDGHTALPFDRRHGHRVFGSSRCGNRGFTPTIRA
ncbi:protein of unknown function [Bradyrhizobium vignae]|uniref:Uncharacterized protein n=1 Tax=Bradyrhizobium vignae TaxID=1549949 RepID=A0A2U3Q9Z5_9BRAD|nr:protein of unknown function [Bradyrhizobium vignae]